MKVILLEDVKSLGKKGQLVDVSDGYARNFILAKKLGLEATSKNMNDLKLQKAHEDKLAAERLAEAKAFAEDLKKVEVTLSIKTGEGGKLFGSVTGKDVADALSQKGIDVDKRKISIKGEVTGIGVYDAVIKVHPEITAVIKVNVVEG